MLRNFGRYEFTPDSGRYGNQRIAIAIFQSAEFFRRVVRAPYVEYDRNIQAASDKTRIGKQPLVRTMDKRNIFRAGQFQQAKRIDIAGEEIAGFSPGRIRR